MTTTTIATKTVKIEYTQAELIRCTAKKDMPEYGVKTGDLFYLARSSKNDGTYYIVRWDFHAMMYTCTCPATKPCRHMKAVSAHAKVRYAAKVQQAHEEKRMAVLEAARIASEAQLARIAAETEAYIAAEQQRIAAKPTRKQSEQARLADMDKRGNKQTVLSSNRPFSLMR